MFLAFGPPSHLRDALQGGLPRLTPRTIITPGMLRDDLARKLDLGYGLNREESEVTVTSAAAPVLDHRRRVIAAVSITGGAHRLDLERLALAVRTAALAPSREPARDSASGNLTLRDSAPRDEADTRPADSLA